MDRALVQCHWVSFCYKFLETWADFLDLVSSQRKRFILFKIRLLQVTSCWRQGSFPKTYKDKSLLTANTSAELLWFTVVLLELFYSSSNLGFPGWQVQCICESCLCSVFAGLPLTEALHLACMYVYAMQHLYTCFYQRNSYLDVCNPPWCCYMQDEFCHAQRSSWNTSLNI